VLPPLRRDGFAIRHYASLGSTNVEARTLATLGCAHGTVIWADVQTAGQGRNGRCWHSRPGNLMVSVVLRPATPAGGAAELGFVSAVAMAGCVAALLPHGSAVQLKWPNDVHIAGAKVAGLLPEAQCLGPDLAWVILGAGLNLLEAPTGLPYAATDLRAHGVVVKPEQALDSFLTQLAHWLRRWEDEGFAPVRAAWLARGAGVGQPVTITLDDRQEHGIFAGLDRDGAMMLSTAAGERRITAGDVAFAGRAG
jgi:BirA family biotin operon repressor/biotin-[acetyl-CoA-carboxylase] ligase